MNIPKNSQIAMLVQADNYAQVELYSRIILSYLPTHPQAHLAIAWAAARTNLLHIAHFHLQQILHHHSMVKLEWFDELSIPKAHQQQLKELQQVNVAPQSTIEQEGYFFIKAWGFGFWSDVSQVLGGLLIADISGRKPLVHWGDNSLFSSQPNNNAFADFFHSDYLCDVNITQIATQDVSFYPDKWNADNILQNNLNKKSGKGSKLSVLDMLGRSETICVLDYYIGVISILPYIPSDHPLFGLDIDDIYRYLVEKYLRPNTSLLARANQFVQQKFAGQAFLAVHVRGSDKVKEFKRIEKIHSDYKRYIDAAQQTFSTVNVPIFLMTDDTRLLQRYQQEYGDRIISVDCMRTDNAEGLHYKNNDQPSKAKQAGEEVLVDVLIAAQSDYFIGTGLSNPSMFVQYFSQWQAGKYQLIGGSRFHDYNTHLYKTISVL